MASSERFSDRQNHIFTATSQNLTVDLFVITCTLTCKKKKLLGDRYVKGVKGIWARTYRKAGCMALLQSCSEGWSTSMSSLLDLKPPRLVMRVEKRRWITLSWTKVFFSKSCQGCWGMRPWPPGREYTLQDHLHLCDCIEEGR